MQSPIHEGYEYQDYFTVSIILQLMLHQTDAELIIDRKDFNGDKFDDLKVNINLLKMILQMVMDMIRH